jgi:hypothetical protein
MLGVGAPELSELLGRHAPVRGRVVALGLRRELLDERFCLADPALYVVGLTPKL